MDLGIAGRVALVQGAGGGLGSAIAHALASEGAHVAVAGRTISTVEATAEAIRAAGGQALALEWDLGNLDLVEPNITVVEDQLGPVDIVVNNTGGPPPTPVLGVAPAEWDRQFRSMVLSVMTIADRVVPGMCERGWGRVVTSTSSGVVAPLPNLAISNTLRAALLAWSKTLAGEVGQSGVTSNIVVPGRIGTARTGFLDRSKADAQGREADDVARESAATIPLGRYGDPAEYAGVIAFLCSSVASYVTGSVVRVDGGLISSI